MSAGQILSGVNLKEPRGEDSLQYCPTEADGGMSSTLLLPIIHY